MSKKSFNELSKRFLELEKHCTSLELSLQQSQEKIKNDKHRKKHDTPLVSDLNNKTFEINHLNAQLQDKNIEIIRDGENLDKMKGKGNACIFLGYSLSLKIMTVLAITKSEDNTSGLELQIQENVPTLDLTSSVVSDADASDKRQQQQDITSSTPTTVAA
ncbi:hypothetical protein Tco_0025729 [Tanacetum coccineum]